MKSLLVWSLFSLIFCSCGHKEEKVVESVKLESQVADITREFTIVGDEPSLCGLNGYYAVLARPEGDPAVIVLVPIQNGVFVSREFLGPGFKLKNVKLFKFKGTGAYSTNMYVGSPTFRSK